MNSKKVLVAGATGYLGKHLVKELKNRGYWVRVLIRKENQKNLFDSIDDYFDFNSGGDWDGDYDFDFD